jgi:ferredoxin
MIEVNQNQCIGCGMCASTCPDTFKINEAGKSEVISQANVDCAREAAAVCPVQAISVK